MFIIQMLMVKMNIFPNVIEHYCENFFGEYYDKEVGLLNFGDDYQPLKGEVAPLPKK
jgi:hypothetical protein